MSWNCFIEQSTRSIHERQQWRHTSIPRPDLISFSSNDYLGLSNHPRVVDAAQSALQKYGIGPRGSALVCGYTDMHAQLESQLSALKKTEATLLTPTGFSANLSVFSALAGPDLEIFSDALNHASIVDGCSLAKRKSAVVTVYEHADMVDLEDKLKRSSASRKLVVTDTLFSMDGDLAPLDSIAKLVQRYDAWLMVDEAHATLVFGTMGGGLTEQHGIEPTINVGTLSKAFGTIGGFVSTSHEVRDLLVNRGRAFIYSTAIPVPLVAASIEAMAVAKEEPLRELLWRNVNLFANELNVDATSPIFSIEVGQEKLALDLSDALRTAGFFAPAIRPPTVPMGQSRVRIALNSNHQPEDLLSLAQRIRTHK